MLGSRHAGHRRPAGLRVAREASKTSCQTVLRSRCPGIVLTTVHAFEQQANVQCDPARPRPGLPLSSTMINISHPKIHGKPPAKRSAASSDVVFEQREVVQDARGVLGKKSGPICTAGSDKTDHNRNVLESSACSIEQLCNMISDLEKGAIAQTADTEELQLEPEKDVSERRDESTGATYDDIMSFLAKLEGDSQNDADSKLDGSEVDARILGEIFAGTDVFPPNVSCDRGDLAALRLELEEKSATVSLLKEQLRAERTVACEKLSEQKKRTASKLHQLEDKYKGIVKRHQKFVEQLISEKTDLTEKCNSLAQRVNEIEIKMQRDSKAAAKRHAVELQRAKEHCVAAEKIKRERWIESRTTKIKEMTVKGLEPELRNMTEQHAEEIQRLRNAHTKELQDTELRIIRRSNTQLEQLRFELTASHERVLTSEKNALWTRYQEKLKEQEDLFKEKQTRLVSEFEYSAEKFEKEQAKRDAEWESNLQRVHSQYQQEIETLGHQCSSDKKTLRESLKTEWEAWLADYKKRQNLRIEQTENRIRDESNKERDRQIEVVIERLEKNTRATKLTLERNFDCKLRCLTEEFDVELKVAKSNEQLHKGKVMRAMEELEKAQTQLQQTEKRLQESMSELNNANEIVKQLSLQRDGAKKLARQEIEGEKRELEEKIASLYQEITRIHANRDTSMAQLHSRIKLILTQKILTIKRLHAELNDVKSKSERMEKLLDQQRREYILNGL